MSGSPKYSTVRVSAARARREAAAAAQRAAARRERAAARQARLRQQQAQRERDRQRRQAEQVAAALGDQQRALEAGLAEIRALVTQSRAAPGSAGPARQAQLTEVEQAVAGLQAEIRGGSDVARYRAEVAALRSRAVALRQELRGTERAVGRPAIVASLRERLGAARATVPAGDDIAVAQFARCDKLLSELDTAAGEPAGVRFEVLHGSAEHAVARAEHLAAEAAAAERAAAERAAAGRAAAGRAAAGRAAAGRAGAGAALVPEPGPAPADDPGDALAGLGERLAVLRDPVLAASSDAAAFEDFALRDQLDQALRTADTALAAGRADAALTAVSQLEELLPVAEERLDGLLAAHERRGELALALRDVMADQGMAYLGGDAEGAKFQLRFERPSGAVYTTTIDSDREGGVVLTYAIDGEPDIRVPAEAAASRRPATRPRRSSPVSISCWPGTGSTSAS